MSTWALRRQAIVITYIILIALMGAAIFYFFVLYQAPSCFDGTQNGYEEGVDCGGGCQLVCPFSATEPNILWARAFEVAPGVYNLAAEVENPNFNVGTNVQYSFKGYDSDNVLITEVNQQVALYPTERRIIFEPAVETGNRTLERVFLEFEGNSGWYSVEKTPERITTNSYKLENTDTRPSLRVVLQNKDVRPVQNLTVMAVLYNQEENIEQVSQTYVEAVPADDTAEAFFSWRRAFENTIQRVEVFVVEPRT